MIELAYKLHFHTPAHIGTGTGFAGFLDNIVIRDSQDTIYIPGSTIKGKSRAAVRRLARALDRKLCPIGEPCTLPYGPPCIACRIFGSPHFPGAIYFDNVELSDSYRRVLDELRKRDKIAARRALTQRRTSVKLDRKRRSASTNHLFTTEMVNPALPLQGRISMLGPGVTGHVSEMKDELSFLWASLELITHMGRSRGRGLGACEFIVTQALHDGQPFTRTEYLATLAPAETSLIEEATS